MTKYKPPIDISVPETEVLTSFNKTKLSLHEKIKMSELFLVCVSTFYALELLTGEPSLNKQLQIAIELNKPSIIMIDSNLPNSFKIEIKNKFSKLKIIKLIEYNFNNPEQKAKATEEINTIIDELKNKHEG